jgi:hypothetical protein
MRDIEAAYKDALVEEYEAYVRANRKADAEQVAAVLKDRYDHDVAEQDSDTEEKKPSPAPERADAEKAPENTAEPKPRRTPRAKTASDDKAGS